MSWYEEAHKDVKLTVEEQEHFNILFEEIKNQQKLTKSYREDYAAYLAIENILKMRPYKYEAKPDLSLSQFNDLVAKINSYKHTSIPKYKVTNVWEKIKTLFEFIQKPNLKISPGELNLYYDKMIKLPFGFYLCRYSPDYQTPSLPKYTLCKVYLFIDRYKGFKLYPLVKIIDLI